MKYKVTNKIEMLNEEFDLEEYNMTNDDYVNDYKFNLYQIAYLSDEQIQQFKSDFRVVAEFFSQKRKQLDYTPSNQQLQHAKEVLQLFSIMG